MIDLELLITKTNNIQNCLKRIHDTVKDDLSCLNKLDPQDIVVLNLQRAIQITIDMASHIVASEKIGIPQSLKETFILLQREGWLDSELSMKMQKMIGFRNIAVHDYQAINPDILKIIITTHLQDLEDFYTTILTFAQKEP